MELELSREIFTQTLRCQKCEQCAVFKNENRIIRNKLIDYKQKLSKEKAVVAELKKSK